MKEMVRTAFTKDGIIYFTICYSSIWDAWIIYKNNIFCGMKDHRTDALDYANKFETN